MNSAEVSAHRSANPLSFCKSTFSITTFDLLSCDDHARGRGGAYGATPEACARLLAALAVNAIPITDEVTQTSPELQLREQLAKAEYCICRSVSLN